MTGSPGTHRDPSRCPACERKVINRRLARCEFCDAPLPAVARMTPEEEWESRLRAKDAEEHAREKRHEEREQRAEQRRRRRRMPPMGI